MDEFEPRLEPSVPTPDQGTNVPFSPPTFLEPPAPLTVRFDLHLYFILLGASLLGTLAILPYTYSLMKQMAMPLPPAVIPAALAATVVLELLLSAAMIAIGLGLGPRFEMGRVFEPAPPMAQATRARRFWNYIGEPLVLGIGLGVIIMVVLSKIDVAGVDGKAIATPDVWEGLLASIGAGIREEVWLRFGVLTFCVWVGLKFARRLPPHGEMPSSRLLWTANIIAALGFAAMHVPQAQMLIGLTGRLLVFIFVGNGVPGLVFGWLYWRRGLVPAMVAHFGLDLVLKVLVPLVS